ncbi:FAD-binding domain-containing protein [Periconia macrospinosa]|uniref:FAD-binding domain-containing protein n=1 Tax=Periconia macrospinosa TaxID=97972 RepID=A0A2V1DJG5_9PLEO|nr:FAD-binding domain-containing protein [Periconia macrospinosa]
MASRTNIIRTVVFSFSSLYNFAHKNNLAIIGGISSTVGTAGGWISGGGHSQMSNAFGLGVDNVSQIKTVLPNGNPITANEFQNQDMWFALRGGGGGTFGVNYEMTSKALPATTRFTFASPLLSLAEATPSMQPVFDKLTASLGTSVSLNATVSNYGSFYESYERVFVPGVQLIAVATDLVFRVGCVLTMMHI